MYRGRKPDLQQEKYKKLLKDLFHYRDEIQYQEEVIESYEPHFNEAQARFFEKYEVNIQTLRDNGQARIASLQKNTECSIKKPKTISTRGFSRIYKEIAKKIHPDKVGIEDDEAFKIAAKAYQQKDWARLLQVAVDNNCAPDKYTKAMAVDLQKQILFLKNKAEVNSTRYVWKYYECDDDEACVESLIKSMLQHVYNYNMD